MTYARKGNRVGLPPPYCRVGIVSGTYIFKPPLEAYWKQEQKQAADAGTHLPAGPEKSASE